METGSNYIRKFILAVILFFSTHLLYAQQITTNGKPAELDIRQAGEVSVRITLKSLSFDKKFPFSPALAEHRYPDPVISLREISEPVKKQVGNLQVEVQPDPITVSVTNGKGQLVQKITFNHNGNLSFKLDDQPVLGMGEGGPEHERGANWRQQPVEFNRKGRLFKMRPRWQSGAYGSRNPVPFMIGTKGWGLFIATPWGQVDLRDKNQGTYIPWNPSKAAKHPQTAENQQRNLGKGKPPVDSIVPGLYDVFVFDAHRPARMMKDVSMLTGPAVMPPKWALGYMQSHRTLQNDRQMINIVDTFRDKRIPIDATIYLGTGFCPRGWNTEQPSFKFNPQVFRRDPKKVISDIHDRHVKFVVHMVPWDRDKLPTLHGNIPPKPGEKVDAGHIKSYWQQHIPLVKAGVDAWWPDEGDWFNLFERMERHKMYYQGPTSTKPNTRPWSLHRNGYLGIARWGGWIWSGDTQSSWKTLQTQIAVGLNYSLSLSPFWGSDIGGFYPNKDLTGELYARWFQFGAFSPSFRAHGKTWWTRLPWGWGLSKMGPLENGPNEPKVSELNNPRIEPIAKKYDDLRYKLLPYNYTLAWKARTTGMPFMRALWLQYPNDPKAARTGDEYLWGPDMLVAPIYTEGATSRDVYLPEGEWYDWWTNKKLTGGKTINRDVDLATMPIYVSAGAIIPLDPVRQYVYQKVNSSTILRIYPDADGEFTLYNDDGKSLGYLDGESEKVKISWDDETRKLTMEPFENSKDDFITGRKFRVQLVTTPIEKVVTYNGKRLEIKMN